jgi:hypothetical protein
MPPLGVKGNNLPNRMDTRIGPACPIYPNLRLSDSPERLFNFALNGPALRLDLKAQEVSAVILDGRPVTAHTGHKQSKR